MNLLYTPQKALSFLISSHLFNTENISKKIIDTTSIDMGNVLVDYKSDLSLLNTPERFYYSNSNETEPVDVKKLKHIAGYGNSELVKYDGRGIYFLDKISDGLWKLEVYPDAVWLKDPFGRNGLDEPVAKLIWKPHQIKINLPGLNSDFKVYSIGESSQSAVDFSLKLQPGVYFITNDENFSVKNETVDYMDFEKIKKYGEYINSFQLTEIKNITPSSYYENEEKKIIVDIYSYEENLDPVLFIKKTNWRSYQKFQMQKVDDFVYEFLLPPELSTNGLLNYFISLNKNESTLTYPGKLKYLPEYWSFNPDDSYTLSILSSVNKILIYNPETDADNVIISNIWRFADYRIDYTFDEEFEQELSIDIIDIKDKFPELATQIYVGCYLNNIQHGNAQLELEMRSTIKEIDSVSIRVLYDNLSGFETKIPVSIEYEKINIPLLQPEKFKFALLPRPFPTFLPYWFESVPQPNSFSNLKPESIQIAIPLPDPGRELSEYGIKLKKINLITVKKSE